MAGLLAGHPIKNEIGYFSAMNKMIEEQKAHLEETPLRADLELPCAPGLREAGRLIRCRIKGPKTLVGHCNSASEFVD